MGIFGRFFGQDRRRTQREAFVNPDVFSPETSRRLEEAAKRAGEGLLTPEKREEARVADLAPDEKWAESGEWQDVESSNVAAIRWNADKGHLEIRYHDGIAWWYEVPLMMALSMYNAGSHGEWVWTNLRVRGKGGDAKHQVPAGPL